MRGPKCSLDMQLWLEVYAEEEGLAQIAEPRSTAHNNMHTTCRRSEGCFKLSRTPNHAEAERQHLAHIAEQLQHIMRCMQHIQCPAPCDA